MESPVRLLECSICSAPALAITATAGNTALLSACKVVVDRLGRKVSPLPVLLFGQVVSEISNISGASLKHLSKMADAAVVAILLGGCLLAAQLPGGDGGNNKELYL